MKHRILNYVALLPIVFLMVSIFVSSGAFGSNASAAVSTNTTTITNKAKLACAANNGFGTDQADEYAKTTQGEACVKAFVAVYQDPSKGTNNSYCKDASGKLKTGCSLEGISLAISVRAADAKAGGSSSTKNEIPSDTKLAAQAVSANYCATGNDSCIAGYIAGYKGSPKESTACASGNTVSGYKVTRVNDCKTAYTQGKNDASGAKNPASGSDAAIKAADAATSTETGNDTSGGIDKLSCDYSSSKISWLICPIVDGLVAFIGAADNIITDQLSVNTNDIFCDNSEYSDAANNPKTCEDYYNAWKGFRNIALGIMLIAGLVILISQALGLELLDAYTIRKTLPRLLIAAVGISLSWPLMQFGITLTNDLGYGIRTLIYEPFNNLNNEIKFTFAGGAGATFLAGGALLAFGILGLLSYAATAALAVFVAILVLVIRQVAITVMVILAPVAIVCYILPNTQRVYKLWYESFTKALLMFPLIAAFIAAGRVFSAIALEGGPISQMVGFVAYFAPYFLIPLTFRMAGSFMSQVGGFVNDRGRGGFDRLSKYRGNRLKQFGQDVQSGQALRQYGAGRPGGVRHRINTGLQKASLVGNAGIRPSMWRENVRQAVSARDNRGTSKELLQNEALSTVRGNDTLTEALARNDFDLDKTRADLASQDGISDAQAANMVSAYAVARGNLSKQGFSERAIQTATVISGLSASTAHTHESDYDEDGNYIGAGNLAATIQKLSGGDGNLQAQMIAAAMEASSERGELAPSFTELFGAVADIEAASSQGPAARRQQILDTSKTLRRTAIRKKGLNVLFGNAHTSRHMALEYQDMLNEKWEELKAIEGPVRQQVEQDERARLQLPAIGPLNPEQTVALDTAVQKSLSEIPQLTAAKDEWMQMVAEMTSAQNNAANLALEKRPIIGELISHELDSTGATVQSESYRLRLNADFQKYVSDFTFLQQHRQVDGGTAAAAAAAQAGAQGGQQGPGGAGPAPPLPG